MSNVSCIDIELGDPRKGQIQVRLKLSIFYELKL